jgi:hypothetical protein
MLAHEKVLERLGEREMERICVNHDFIAAFQHLVKIARIRQTAALNRGEFVHSIGATAGFAIPKHIAHHIAITSPWGSIFYETRYLNSVFHSQRTYLHSKIS